MEFVTLSFFAQTDEPEPGRGQLSIDFEPRRAARRTDPVTSQRAAESASRFASSHAGRILAALIEHGPGSAHDIAHRTGLSVVQVDRRTTELERAGRIRLVMVGSVVLVRGGARVWQHV